MKKNPNEHVSKHDLQIYYNMGGTSVSVRCKQKLSTQQLYGNRLNDKSYQEFEVTEFNSIQQKLYREVIYGVENFKPSERKKMTEIELGLVAERHEKAQRVINQFKNEVVATLCDRIFKKFWNSDIAKEMLDFSETPDTKDLPNDMSFKELGIKKHQVAVRLIEHGILPVNFFQLSA